MAKPNRLRAVTTDRNAVKQHFSKNLRRLLRESGVTQTELADYLGISASSIRTYLCDKPSIASLDTSVMIAEAFGVSLEQMYREFEDDVVVEDGGVPVAGVVYHKGDKVVLVLDLPKQFEGRFDDTLVCQKVA